MKDEDKTKEQLINELVELREQLAEMGWQPAKPEEEVGVKDEKGNAGVAHDRESPYGAAEPWLPVETKLVGISVVAGIIALVMLAILVHMFLLGGH
jgi:hypothetical protein